MLKDLLLATLLKMKDKGVSGKKNPTPRKMETEEKEILELVKVEYLDPLLVKNADPRHYEPSIREVVGWRIDEPDDEFMIIMSDKPVSYQPFEKLRPESAYIIPKTAVIRLSYIRLKALRSGKNN